MNYKLDILSGIGIVSVKNEGRLTFHKAREYSIEATKLAHLNKCNKYLIDHIDTDFEQGVYKLHTDGAALELFGFKHTDRVAVIISNRKNKYYLNAKHPQEAGWCIVKYFTNTKNAVDWLCKKMK